MMSELKEALDVLEEAAYQECWSDEDKCLDSCAISSRARMLRFLARHGRVEIVTDVGRRVIARPSGSSHG